MNKIAIISDIHGSINILKKALKHIKKREIDTTIICGDLDNLEVLKFLTKYQNIHFHIVFGNAENQKFKMMACADQSQNLSIHGDQMKLSFNYKNKIFRIFASHYPHIAKEFCLSDQFQLCCHGHTHVKNHQKIHNCDLICPGNLCGIKENPSFAIYNFKEQSLKYISI